MQNRNQKGFTLIELIVAIVIMGVVTSFVGSRTQGIMVTLHDREYEAYAASLERAAKLYIDANDKDIFGENINGCYDMKYEKLVNTNLVHDIQKEDVTCQGENTFVRVRKLKNGEYDYETQLKCVNRDTSQEEYNNKLITTQESVNSCLIEEDKEAPKVTAAPIGFYCQNTSTAQEITVTVEDSGIGLKENTNLKYAWVKDYNSSSTPTYKTISLNNKAYDKKVEVTLPKKDYPMDTGNYALLLGEVSDAAGNKSEPKSANGYTNTSTFCFDNTPPTCSIDKPSANSNGWYNSNITLTLNTNDGDNQSGVAKYGITTSASGKPSANYDNSSTCSIVTENNGTIVGYGFVKDGAGNINDCSVGGNKLDKTAPNVPTSTMYAPNQDNYLYANNTGFSKTLVRISYFNPNGYTVGQPLRWSNFSASDTGSVQSGVDHYEYSRSGGAATRFGLSSYDYGKDTNYSFRIRSCDKAGNCSSWSGNYNIKVNW